MILLQLQRFSLLSSLYLLNKPSILLQTKLYVTKKPWPLNFTFNLRFHL